MNSPVLILGGGLAGLAVASAFATRQVPVTILEARQRLGGRASSFLDSTSGLLLDNCQHVSMGCCTNLAHFCQVVGVQRFLQPQPSLFFMTPDRRLSPFAADPLPVPLHLLRSFARLHTLTVGEKLRIAHGLRQLQRTPETNDPPFLDWLLNHRQTPRTIERFWGLVLVSALNESPERIGLRYARKVFVDGFLRHRRGCQVEIPSVPLGQLYGTELLEWLSRHQVEVRLGMGVRALQIENQRVSAVVLRTGEVLQPEWVVSTVPFDRLLDLLPSDLAEKEPYFAGLRHLETSPITSVHLWYTRPVLSLPHVVLVDCVGQWVFQRKEGNPHEHYVQVVVSASRRFQETQHREVEALITAEMERLFPDANRKNLLRVRVVTERSATFSVVPGVDRWRPTQTSPIENLFLAGDWTATGWPATMESAVRSGYLAAQALLKCLGRPEVLLQPDL